MDRLNLNLLRSLAQILEFRNITQAASELRLTQSAISRQLAQLREYFEDPLLVREGNDYFLTAKAQRLQPKLKALFEQVEELRYEDQFDPMLCHRTFTFACTDYVGNFIFPNAVAEIYNRAPNINLKFKIWQPEWLDDLGNQSVDFAATMIGSVPENLYGTHLGIDDPVFLMKMGHPIVQCTSLSLDDWLSYPFVKITTGGDKDSFIDIELNRLHRRRRIAFEVPFFSSAFEAVSKTDFIAIVPRHIAAKACEFYPLRYSEIPLERLPKHNYYMIWHSVHHHDIAHRWIRSVIAEYMCGSMDLSTSQS